MTIGEATAINVVLTALIGQKQVLDAVGFRAPADSAIALVRNDAAMLADHAHKVLMAGLTGDDIDRALEGGTAAV
jgi:hypothetical protein